MNHPNTMEVALRLDERPELALWTNQACVLWSILTAYAANGPRVNSIYKELDALHTRVLYAVIGRALAELEGLDISAHQVRAMEITPAAVVCSYLPSSSASPADAGVAGAELEDFLRALRSASLPGGPRAGSTN